MEKQKELLAIQAELEAMGAQERAQATKTEVRYTVLMVFLHAFAHL